MQCFCNINMPGMTISDRTKALICGMLVTLCSNNYEIGVCPGRKKTQRGERDYRVETNRQGVCVCACVRARARLCACVSLSGLFASVK